MQATGVGDMGGRLEGLMIQIRGRGWAGCTSHGAIYFSPALAPVGYGGQAPMGWGEASGKRGGKALGSRFLVVTEKRAEQGGEGVLSAGCGCAWPKCL